MLYNVEKCTLNIYRSRVIYFETLVATLDLKINSWGKNDQTKGGSLGTRGHPARDFFHQKHSPDYCGSSGGHLRFQIVQEGAQICTTMLKSAL